MTLDTGPCPARRTTYVYDFAGQRVASQDTVQGEATPAGRAVETYTAAGQLFFSLTPLPSGAPNNYALGWTWYDAGGLRAITKTAWSTTSYPVPDTTVTGPYSAFVYDGGQPVLILQRGTNGTWSVADRMVVAGTDRPVAGLYNGQILALVTDRSGTVLAGVQPNGHADQLATYADHGPFGDPQNAGGALTGGDVQAGFTGAGGTPNGLGLVYLRNRWYDPQTGRFLTQDPIGLAGGVNLYAYAGGNPVSYSDPFGLGPEDCKKVKCPSLRTIATDKTVATAGAAMLKASEKDGAERGAYLFNGPNGTIRVGPVQVGKPGEGLVKLGPAPDDAIGSIHTHPTIPGANGMTFPGGPPSGDDAALVKFGNINGVVESKEARYFQPWQNPGVYFTVETKR